MEHQENDTYQKRAPFSASLVQQLHRYRKLFRSYWWILLITIALGVGLQFLWVRNAPPVFTSTGRMIMNFKLSLPTANVYSEELYNFFGTQEELMRSESVRNRVYSRLSATNAALQPTPVRIGVVLSPKTSIFNLTAIGEDPAYVQAYLDATMEEYINLKRELLENASSSARAKTQEELRQLTAQLQKSKQELFHYQSSNSVVLLQTRDGNSAAEFLSVLTRQLAEQRSELQLLKSLTLDQNLERQAGLRETQAGGSTPNLSVQSSARLSQPTNALNTQVTSALPPGQNRGRSTPNQEGSLEPQQPLSLGALESGYLEAKKQLLLLQARKAAVSKIVASPARVLVALDEEIAHQETLLSIFREQSEQQLKNRQQTLELQIRGLENQIAEWNSKALEASEKLSGFEALKENDRRLQGMVDQLQATLHSLDVDKGIRQESVAILQPASPARMSPPLLVRQLIMAGLIGAALGLMILFLIDYFDDRPSSFAELEALFPEPVLGQIQLVAAKDRKSKVHILEKDDNRHALVEAYSNLRSALIFKDSPHDHPKRIVVSSAIPGEGKSMVCASLAVTFAQAGARVLLVDADLRRGVLHEHFSVPSSPGFAEVLAEQCSWSKSIAQTGVPNLDFIACGARPQRPSGLLLKNTERFLDEVANHYDYCFFDTAPVMAADDVSSLAPHVDGLLMVIRAGCTSGRIAKAALDALHLRRVNVIGLVFNAVKPGTSDYYYYGHKEYFPTKACA